jgi:hypothetical protein
MCAQREEQIDHEDPHICQIEDLAWIQISNNDCSQNSKFVNRNGRQRHLCLEDSDMKNNFA